MKTVAQAKILDEPVTSILEPAYSHLRIPADTVSPQYPVSCIERFRDMSAMWTPEALIWCAPHGNGPDSQALPRSGPYYEPLKRDLCHLVE